MLIQHALGLDLASPLKKERSNVSLEHVFIVVPWTTLLEIALSQTKAIEAGEGTEAEEEDIVDGVPNPLTETDNLSTMKDMKKSECLQQTRLVRQYPMQMSYR